MEVTKASNDEPELNGPVVLHLFNKLDPGGAEMRTLEAIEALKGRDITFVLGVTGHRGGALEERFIEAGASVVTIPWGLGFARKLRSVIKTRGVTVLHAHSSTASGVFMLLAAIMGVPKRIAHFRSDSDGGHNTLRRRLQRLVLRTMIRVFATDVLGVTPKAVEFAGPWTETSPRARFVPSGLVTPELPDEWIQTQIREQAGVLPGELLLVHVGRGGSVKNRKRAVELLSAAWNEGVPSRLLLVGRYDSEERQALEELASGSGALAGITFSGQVPSAAPYLAAADLLLVTSLREGMPGVVLEAVALGTPVVSSDVSGSVLISREFDEVRCLSLADSNRNWVRAIEETAARKDRQERQRALEDFEASKFSMRVGAEEFLRIWSGSEDPANSNRNF